MQIDPTKFQVETHTAPIWEQEQTFQEIMAEQLRHAPWLMLSMVIHGIAIAIFLLMPPTITLLDDKALIMAPPDEEEIIEEEEEPEEEPEEEEPEEPVLTEVELTEEEITEEETFEEEETESAFNSDQWNTAIGLGGGAAGKFGGRGGGRGKLGKGSGRATARAIELGLEWLKKHQDEDGKWDADDFMKHDTDGTPCDGVGNPVHDIGLTGLALLAFLGDGSTMRSGAYKDVVKKAVMWLRKEQDPDTGLFGSNTSHDFLYDHSIAALAMVEAYGLSNSKLLKKYAQKGINYLESHRNPYMVWRYQPRDNDNDTSVTGWCVMAYKSAQDFKLQVNEQATKLSATWFDSVTDPVSGRCGYQKRGEPSSRQHGDHTTRFPPEKGEALTAVGLLCRFFLGQNPKDSPVMTAAADTLLSKPPNWDDKTGDIDHYYWYYATYALYQMGGRHWKDWSKKLTPAVVKTQREDGNFKGSWDAIGAWGEDGGRVYSTATLVLTLEAYYRYTRVFVR